MKNDILIKLSPGARSDLLPTQKDVFEAAWGFISPARRKGFQILQQMSVSVRVAVFREPVVLWTVSLVQGGAGA